MWFWRAVVVSGPAAIVALWAGWTTTEVGRQPWIVYRVMRTSEAVTATEGVPIGLIVLLVTYLALGTVTLWVLRRMSRIPWQIAPDAPSPASAES